MMFQSSELSTLVNVWALVAGLIVLSRLGRPRRGVGLVLVYTFGLWLNHWIGALIYTFPWYGGGRFTLTATGFEQSLYAVAAFAGGALLVTPLGEQLLERRSVVHQERTKTATQTSADVAFSRQLPMLYFLLGLLSYLFLTPLLGGIPTLSALLSVGNDLMLVGVGLACWHAWRQGDRRTFALWLGVALGFPLLTLINQGFLGFGVTAFVTVFMFVASFVRPRWKLVLAALLLAFVGLSVYVTYMRDRQGLRGAIWGGQTFEGRLDAVADTFSELEWFDYRDLNHLAYIDGRLNQNHLVGAGVQYLEGGRQVYARGETLWMALIAPIPRALWPGKPVVAGSMGLVSQYTGIPFAQGTSVGLGPVLEFYINFGTEGVVAGFFLMGLIVAAIDVAAARALQRGEWDRFLLWYLPGLGLLATGGSLVEATASAGAGLVTAFIVVRYVVPFLIEHLGRPMPEGRKEAVSLRDGRRW